jgi:hypothetical protein
MSARSSDGEAMFLRWCCCVHEAAHAVAYLATGLKIAEVWVDGTEGRCRCQRGPDNAIGCLAGVAAEWRLQYPGRLPNGQTLLRYLESDDIAHAVRCVGVADGDLLEQVCIAARRLIDEHWAAVVRIAAALLQDGRLSGEQVEQIWRARRMAA